MLEKEFGVRIKNNGCSNCLGALYLSLKKANVEYASLLRGLEIILGPHEEENDKLYFGNCSIGYQHGIKKYCVPGCPPITSEFIITLKKLKEKKMS